MTVSEDFTRRTGRFRGELLAYCYRMLGSAEEAEDLVQETYLRAWRSFDGFEGRSSVRTWLYRIATNVCLTAIERRGRRPLPSGLGGPTGDPGTPVVAAPEVPWLQPFPGALLAAEGEDPAAVAVSRAGIRLALVAALQYLSARQRAVLILRDVLGWPAAQVADLLGTTATAVNSGLRRPRARLAEALPAEDELAEPAEPDRRALLERFAAAFENADAGALAQLLAEDVALEMRNWHVDVQQVFHWTREALLRPLGPGNVVIAFSSGAALARSPPVRRLRGRQGHHPVHRVLRRRGVRGGKARYQVRLGPAETDTIDQPGGAFRRGVRGQGRRGCCHLHRKPRPRPHPGASRGEHRRTRRRPQLPLLIHHIGARSGIERVTPVAYHPQGEGRFAIWAANGGSPAHPAWYYNLKAHPRITAEVGAQAFTVLAQELDDTARAELWPKLVSAYPQLAGAQAKTTRQIPVFMLTRQG